MKDEKLLNWLYADMDELIDFNYEEEPKCPSPEVKN